MYLIFFDNPLFDVINFSVEYELKRQCKSNPVHRPQIMSNAQEQNDDNLVTSIDQSIGSPPNEGNSEPNAASQPSVSTANQNQNENRGSTNPPNPPNPSQSHPLSNLTPQQQQQYAKLMRDQQARIYAQHQTQLHYMQQQQQRQQYAAYYQALIKQRQQQSYHHYYQQIAQQYGYPAMVQAINQQIANHPHTLTRNLPIPPMSHPGVSPQAQLYSNANYPMPINMNMSMNMNMAKMNISQSQSQEHHHEPQRSSNGSIILSCEEQPGLMASFNPKSRKRGRGKGKGKRNRKRKKPTNENDENNDDASDEYVNQTVSLDPEQDDDMLLGLDKDAYDKGTLINENEYLPDIKTEFDEWLYFSKKLWQRQKKYKHFIIDQNRNRQNPYHHEPRRKRQKISESQTRKETIDLSETISTIEDDTNNGSVDLNLKSAFMSGVLLIHNRY